MEQCSGVESFYEGFQEKLQNATLYVLTIASVAIMPAQTMTGMFGMNFAEPGSDSAEGLQDPMLKTKYGYWIFFWGLGGLLTGLTVYWMHMKGILKSRSTSWSSVRRQRTHTVCRLRARARACVCVLFIAFCGLIRDRGSAQAITEETLGDEAAREKENQRFRRPTVMIPDM